MTKKNDNKKKKKKKDVVKKEDDKQLSIAGDVSPMTLAFGFKPRKDKPYTQVYYKSQSKKYAFYVKDEKTGEDIKKEEEVIEMILIRRHYKIQPIDSEGDGFEPEFTSNEFMAFTEPIVIYDESGFEKKPIRGFENYYNYKEWRHAERQKNGYERNNAGLKVVLYGLVDGNLCRLEVSHTSLIPISDYANGLRDNNTPPYSIYTVCGHQLKENASGKKQNVMDLRMGKVVEKKEGKKAMEILQEMHKEYMNEREHIIQIGEEATRRYKEKKDVEELKVEDIPFGDED